MVTPCGNVTNTILILDKKLNYRCARIYKSTYLQWSLIHVNGKWRSVHVEKAEKNIGSWQHKWYNLIMTFIMLFPMPVYHHFGFRKQILRLAPSGAQFSSQSRGAERKYHFQSPSVPKKPSCLCFLIWRNRLKLLYFFF